ncbi:MAG: 3-deoxy-manno-octulosonate cytidylyltransferase [Saprospiraceae bacterium]
MAINVIAIVPARFASTRLPAKPLSDLGGAPLIVRVCENLKQADVFERIVVACDHREIITVVREAGFEAVFTGPSIPSGTDRVAAAAEELNLPLHARIVNVQGDEPFISKECLQAVANRLEIGEDAIITAIERTDDDAVLLDRNAVKVAMGTNERALYFSRSPIPHVRDVDEDNEMDWHFRHIGIYGYTMETLMRITKQPVHQLEQMEKLEQLRWMAHGEKIVCPCVEPSPRGVDTPEDLEAANELYAERNA